MNSNPPSNADLAARAIVMQGERDFDGLRAICDPDVILEFPYHPSGPVEHHGVDALVGQFSILRVFQTLTMQPVQVFDTGGEVVVVEARSHGTYRSGRPDYENHYLFVLSFRDGKLIRWREFFNPLEAMKQNYGTSNGPKDGLGRS